MKKHRPKLAPTIPGIFIQAVAREGFLGAAPRDYPYSVPAIRHLTELRFEAPVTFFVGENGSGKSTLLEGIAAAFGLNPEGGTKHERFATQSHAFKPLPLADPHQEPRSAHGLVFLESRVLLQCGVGDGPPGCRSVRRPQPA